ncbi:hydrogenase maturation nickel metallochaperone HypA [Thermodesulfovibrionales bacterium]|nr:hydrogenase maturation nickel metallochaperone HypA [Thermodesulfovibrionales bacterium]
MHEASIADGLLRTAISVCRGNGFSRIEIVRIRIGRASGVMPESLLFAFDALKAETIASESSLVIEEVPVAGYCNTCKRDFTVSGSFILCCPYCSSNSFTVKSGRELDIIEVEVGEDEVKDCLKDT